MRPADVTASTPAGEYWCIRTDSGPGSWDSVPDGADGHLSCR